MAKYAHPIDKLFDTVGRPSYWQHPHWFECPGCGSVAIIELDQYVSTVPIACSCGWTGYRR